MTEILSFGEWVKRRRRALDLTQDELAAHTGCSKELVAKIEADARRPSKQVAALLATALELPSAEHGAFVRAARAELAIDQLPAPAYSVPRPAFVAGATEHAPVPPALPQGTVTFLFTDIEGSTRLWEAVPDAMRLALTRHDAIMRQAIESHGGHVFKTVGDAFCAAFAAAPDALAAAIAGQQALYLAEWETVGSLRVRMALHTGSVKSHAGDYLGQPLNRVARLLSAGHGGQTLISLATHELVRDHLPSGVTLRDLGIHRLKDLSRPEQIFQLHLPDLPTAFPPLQTLDAHRHNLPAQPTPVIGREREIAGVTALLCRADVRLVTLTGPGGTGKTRLALQVASELISQYPDGVYFIDLAPIRDPLLVVSTIVETLGVKESGTQPLIQQLRGYLHTKTMLLLLDNFEQVLHAAPLIAEVLASAPALKVLVTSRAALHVRGEHEFMVPPLVLPDRTHLPPLEHLTQYAAVQLFIARAQAAKADFAVTNATAPAVAEICAQVDGLPLAIELAAVRVKLFPLEALLTRLGQRLPFLTGGPRDLPFRQQTLRNTIEWSYELLDAAEQALFRRLGVLVGGCSLEATKAVCYADGDLSVDVIDGLAALVDKSLVKQVEGIDGEPRFVMLETLREYALEQLAAKGELELIQQRHVDFFVRLAETGLPYEFQEQEHPNFRAALVWSRTNMDRIGELRLLVALDWRHSVSEARLWLAEALAPHADGASYPDSASASALRARALVMLGNIASWQNDMAAAQPALEDSLALFRELGDICNTADVLSSLGRVVLLRGDYERSSALLRESLSLFRQLRDAKGISECCLFMGNLAYAQGQLGRADQCWQEALSEARQLESAWMIATSLLHLGMVALDQGDNEQARVYLAESLTRLRELGDLWMALHALEVCAGLSVARGAGKRAARLFGADEALREPIGLSILAIWGDAYQHRVDTIRTLLDDTTFAIAWAEGRAMTMEQAIAYALSESD